MSTNTRVEWLRTLADNLGTRWAVARSADDSARPALSVEIPARALASTIKALREAADDLLTGHAPDQLATLELVALCFARNHASGNFQGDDEHEAWSAVNAAIAKAKVALRDCD